ncbi:MAG: hypothetical protein GY708_10780 [Actinomycetia bacterium]|nr:hypothetical protein [Actinomycetes bacterium]MCP4960842.1 hypothetical protein [Actinomycetes bacterium]
MNAAVPTLAVVPSAPVDSQESGSSETGFSTALDNAMAGPAARRGARASDGATTSTAPTGDVATTKHALSANKDAGDLTAPDGGAAMADVVAASLVGRAHEAPTSRVVIGFVAIEGAVCDTADNNTDLAAAKTAAPTSMSSLPLTDEGDVHSAPMTSPDAGAVGADGWRTVDSAPKTVVQRAMQRAAGDVEGEVSGSDSDEIVARSTDIVARSPEIVARSPEVVEVARSEIAFVGSAGRSIAAATTSEMPWAAHLGVETPMDRGHGDIHPKDTTETIDFTGRVLDPATASTAEQGDALLVDISETETSGLVPTLDAGPALDLVETDLIPDMTSIQAVQSRVTPTGLDVPNPAGSRAEVHAIEQVLDAVDRVASMTPPRSMTIDLEELHGIRVRIVAEPGGVSVTVDDAGAGSADAQQWQRDLSDLLDQRRQNQDPDQAASDPATVGPSALRTISQPASNSTNSAFDRRL